MEFRKEKMTGLQGTTAVFTEKGTETEPPTDPFKIVATHEGIYFMGRSDWIHTQKDLDQFAKAVSDAWKEHRGLLGAKIQTVGSGH